MTNSNTEDTAALMESIHKEPLSDSLRSIDSFIKYSSRPLGLMFLACSDELLPQIVEYLQARYNISNDSQFTTEIPLKDPRTGELERYLHENAPKIKASNSETALVLVNRFENLIRRYETEFKESVFRAAQDYAQDVLDSNILDNTYLEDTKKVLTVTHIGPSLRPETYKNAIRSAAGSHFKHELIEIK